MLSNLHPFEKLILRVSFYKTQNNTALTEHYQTSLNPSIAVKTSMNPSMHANYQQGRENDLHSKGALKRSFTNLIKQNKISYALASLIFCKVFYLS